MESVKQTHFYSEVLKELNYPFGDVFIFKGFVVAEIKQGVVVSWMEHARHFVQDVAYYLGTDGKDVVYISNRINSYSVKAVDWLKFFKSDYSMKAYCVVSNNPMNKMNLMVENLFFNNKIKHFMSLYEAINWVKKELDEVA
ncbi:hypothetical protein EYD45_05645 [Hyunsoonleella flava]|uniref:STAS/SEC14 domain-containing protein n=1 Tax=Hyunsoonleella flava TaxID=2527939 RepID=A0A4V6MT53_9FLAO|nr:hypothetical protein [Hyunsoonleella flava]TBN04744.1 hypothetical protein EYD45_05645 [Hyunsoonleella flava]